VSTLYYTRVRERINTVDGSKIKLFCFLTLPASNIGFFLVPLRNRVRTCELALGIGRGHGKGKQPLGGRICAHSFSDQSVGRSDWIFMFFILLYCMLLVYVCVSICYELQLNAIDILSS
jgi:hypothetical protein